MASSAAATEPSLELKLEEGCMEEPSSPGESDEDEAAVVRHGNWMTASGHIITAVIGAGILSLPYSLANLGWVGGIAAMLAFAWVTLFTSQLLAEVHIVKGRRQRTYAEAVNTLLGRRGSVALAWLQYTNLILTALAYNMTAAMSLQSLSLSICSSVGSQSCFDSYWAWAAIFGGMQLLLSLVPSLDASAVGSAIGALMSAGYSILALVRSTVEVANGNAHGTLGGIPADPATKVFNVCNSLGSVLFAFSFSQILIEIQDTISGTAKGGPVRAMKRAVNFSVSVMTGFYLAVAVMGYLAWGTAVTENILDSFGSPAWVVDLAMIMVIAHMLPAYQVWSQPVFALVEGWLKGKERAPEYLKGLAFRLCFRSTYVLLLTLWAIAMPFFSTIIGFVGASGFWPTTVLFPIELWIALYQPSRRRKLWLRALSGACLLVSVIALVGSVQQIVTASYCFFCS